MRIRLLAALILSVAAAAAGQEKIITGKLDLNAVSASLPSATERTMTIRIDNYAAPGQLRLGQTNGMPETVTLQRYSNDSDAVIKVDSTFIDAKGFTGTLILKNLAFKLGPKGVLIAGYDANKLNHNLILDSCYLYADTVDGTFLSWQGDAGSNVDIRNSWFVSRATGPNGAIIQIAAATATLKNCLFNFAGTIVAPSIASRFDALANTINRVQFKLIGNAPVGASDPIYTFSQNLFAFPGPVNTLGGDPSYVLKASSFNDVSSSITGNRVYSLWRGIDAPAGAKGQAGKNNPTFEPYDDKASTELWDWYTDQTDPLTGMLAGNSSLRRFNVLPGRNYAETVVGTDTLGAFFRSVEFPRAFQLALGPAPVLLDSAFRLREPYAGRLSLGPFQITEIRHNAVASNGKPVLLALNTGGAFVPQEGQAKAQQAPSVFQNHLPTARVFVLVDSGNTPHGTSVTPTRASFESNEGVTFAKVEEAGQTIPKIIYDRVVPDSLRSLDRVFCFQTTAVVNTTITFKSAKKSVPWTREGDNGLWWWWKSKGLMARALPGAAPGDSLLYGTFPYRTSDGVFSAYLVEKLSIHAGDGYKMPLGASAYLLSYSRAGYQAYPKAYVPDSTRFDSLSAGYSFAWTGRGTADSLFFMLKRPSPSAEVYVLAPGQAGPELLFPQPRVDTAGYFRIPLDSADTGKTYFAGIKYTVLAGPPGFTGAVGDVFVENLVSTRPGRLAFRNLPLAEARKLADKSDTVFRNTNYLGGREIQAGSLAITSAYNLAFAIGKYQDSTKVEVWLLEGGKWKDGTTRGRVSRDTVRATIVNPATHIVIVERFPPPERYFKDSLSTARDSLIFSLTPKSADSGPVVGYCVETRIVYPDGRVEAGVCERKSTNQPTRIKIDTNSGVAYRVTYFEGNAGDPVPLVGDFLYPPQFGWNAKSILKEPALAEFRDVPTSQWRLVGLTAAGKLKSMVSQRPMAVPSKYRDTTVVWGLKTLDNGHVVFDTTIGYKDLAIGPFSAYLMASSRPISLNLDSFPSLPPRTPRPESLAVGPGWSLIGNPYPIYLNRKCVRSKSGARLRLLDFRRKESGGYAWDSIATALKPFRGFAVNLPRADTLYFDPIDTGLAGAAKSAAGSARIRVGIEAAFGGASMALVRGAGEYPIRYLPEPSPGLEMRVGGDGGFWILPVDDLGRVDQPVEIRSSRAGIARFSLGEAGSGPGFALIDQATGTVYDAAAAAELPVAQGNRTYRLFAGDPAFVSAKTGAYLAGAPAETILSQNFPNPARGLTRIAVEWPATRDRDRSAYLEVLDLRGRRLALDRLQDIRVGRQVLEVDAAGWKPGIYVYRLVVNQGGRMIRLQRRMLVAP